MYYSLLHLPLKFPFFPHKLEGTFSPHIRRSDFVVEVLIYSLRPLTNILKVSPRVTLVNLSWSDNFVVGVVQEFVPVSQPSGESWKGEKDGKHLSWDAESLVDDT